MEPTPTAPVAVAASVATAHGSEMSSGAAEGAGGDGGARSDGAAAGSPAVGRDTTVGAAAGPATEEFADTAAEKAAKQEGWRARFIAAASELEKRTAECEQLRSGWQTDTAQWERRDSEHLTEVSHMKDQLKQARTYVRALCVSVCALCVGIIGRTRTPSPSFMADA
jgi:hypothetical protein